MPTIDEIYQFLSGKFPEELCCEWDNDGLMLAPDPNREVIRILCALDVTDDTVDYAINNDYDLIISHHPMIFRPIKGLNYNDPVSRRVFRLLKHDIAVMSFHTRLDAGAGGVNDVFAKLLGLTDVTPFGVDGEMIGRIGTLPAEEDITEFAVNIKKLLHAERILYSKGSGTVHRVAVCGGDGKDFVKAAKAAGADSYVTGQLSYNIMADSGDYGLNLFEAGHFQTEDFVCGYLTLLLLRQYTQVKTGYYSSNRVMCV